MPSRRSAIFLQICLSRRHVECDDLGAVTSHDFGDGRTDAARGAGDQSHLALEWQVPVEIVVFELALADSEYLPGYESRLGREQETQRGFCGFFSRFGHIHEVAGRAFLADFLGHRTGEPLQCALGDVLRRIGFQGIRWQTDHHHAA